MRVIRAVTIRYIWRWLAGWLLFRCLAPGFAGRALVLGFQRKAEPEAGSGWKSPYEAKRRGANHP